jgi:hypothetical protein
MPDKKPEGFFFGNAQWLLRSLFQSRPQPLWRYRAFGLHYLRQE